MEANPDLDPLQIKEILKQTAERRGEPFDTSIDPFWNKDFGWGMVDAHAAVKLSFDLLNSGMEMENYSPYLQLHVTSFSEDLENSSTMISGIAWAQQGEVSAIEYNIDGGAWYQATYEEVNETNQNAPFNWSIQLDPGALSDKNHTIQIRSVGAGDTTNQYSLLSILTIRGTGVSDDSSGGINMFVIISLFIIIGFLLVMFMSQIRQPELLPSYQGPKHQGNNSSGKVLDAELLDVVEDFEKNNPS